MKAATVGIGLAGLAGLAVGAAGTSAVSKTYFRDYEAKNTDKVGARHELARIAAGDLPRTPSREEELQRAAHQHVSIHRGIVPVSIVGGVIAWGGFAWAGVSALASKTALGDHPAASGVGAFGLGVAIGGLAVAGAQWGGHLLDP